jgi:hypothetical protein
LSHDCRENNQFCLLHAQYSMIREEMTVRNILGDPCCVFVRRVSSCSGEATYEYRGELLV